MNTELVLDGMTWGEIRAFVALGSRMPDGEKVGIGYDSEASFEPNVLWVHHEIAPKRGDA